MKAWRSLLALACTATLGYLLLRRDSPAELRARLDYLIRTNRRPLEVRRYERLPADDFDRRYLELLAWARANIPPAAPGVAVVTERPITGRRSYMAVYALVPTPTLVLPDRIPPGWLVLMQGSQRPAGWRVVAESPQGALLAPPS